RRINARVRGYHPGPNLYLLPGPRNTDQTTSKVRSGLCSPDWEPDYRSYVIHILCFAPIIQPGSTATIEAQIPFRIKKHKTHLPGATDCGNPHDRKRIRSTTGLRLRSSRVVSADV